MNQKIAIFSFVALPSPSTKTNHPRWDLGKDFFASLYRKIKDQNPRISEDFTKTFLKWPRDGLETTWRQCWSFRAEKRSAHPLLPAFVCLVLWEFWLRLNEIYEVRMFAPCKGFFFVFVVVVFSSLENYFGFRTTNVRVKTDHPSVWGGIKRFEHFQRGLYFSDNCAFDLWIDFVSSASPSFAGLN